jgi:multidrug efflux pump subunit AcrB
MLFILVAANFKSYKSGGVLMLTFLLGFYGIMPGFAFLYALDGTFMSATSTIGIISIAGIVIGNGIIFLEYYLQLRQE